MLAERPVGEGLHPDLTHHDFAFKAARFATTLLIPPLESFIHYPLAPKYTTTPFKNHPLQKHRKSQIKNLSFFEGGVFFITLMVPKFLT